MIIDNNNDILPGVISPNNQNKNQERIITSNQVHSNT